jgi:hypothetical protein
MAERMGRVIADNFDIDYIDIYRANPTTYELQLQAPNLPCNFEIKQTDNPDPLTIDIKPVIMSIVIHFPITYDIQNDDYIIIKRTHLNGELIAFYQGRCGEIATYLSRKTVNVAIQTAGGQLPKPPTPPQHETSLLTLDFLNDKQENINPRIMSEIPKYIPYKILPPLINGFVFAYAYLDGVINRRRRTIQIKNPISDSYHLELFYTPTGTVTGFRTLIKGLYTDDTGKLKNGLHLYASKPCTIISDIEMQTDFNNFIHEETYDTITLKDGLKIRLEPIEQWQQIKSIAKGEDGKYSVIFEDYEPIEEEQNAYITNKYN